MLTERSIINCLLWVGGLILAPYLAVSLLYSNFIPLAIVGTLASAAAVFGIWRDKLIILPIIGMTIGGKIPSLPLQLSPAELGSIALVAYYLIAYVALQREKVKTGPMYFFLPLVIMGAIILYHEHNFGVRAFGGGMEGSRGAIFILLAFVTYLCGISVKTPSPQFFAGIPLYCFLASIVSALPYTISTYFPFTTGALLLVTSNVNSSALANAMSDQEEIVRNSGPANMAMYLMMLLVCTYPLYTWWKPNRLWVAALGVLCTFLVVLGGFRSALSNFAEMVLISTWCYYGWRALLVVLPFAFGILLATELQDSHLVNLPLAAQRTLAFIPGDWDPGVMETTLASNDFRQRIQALYLREEVGKSPFFGNGFSYDSAEFARFNYLAVTQDDSEHYYNTKIYVYGKIFHVGWISLYDSIGLVGGAAFCFFVFSILWVLNKMIFGPQADRGSILLPVKIWMFSNVLTAFIGYFTVFGDIKSALPSFCCYAIFAVHINRLEKMGYSAPSTSEVPISSNELEALPVS